MVYGTRLSNDQRRIRKEVENNAVESGEQSGDLGRKEKEKANSVTKDLEKIRRRKARERSIDFLDQPLSSLHGTRI